MRWTEEQLLAWELRKSLDTPNGQAADSGPESELQRKCEKWLRENGLPFIHDKSRGKNKAGSILDLVCFLDEGRVVVIELKAKRGKLSDEQKQTIQRLKYLKHEVHEMRSYKRFLYLMLNS